MTDGRIVVTIIGIPVAGSVVYINVGSLVDVVAVGRSVGILDGTNVVELVASVDGGIEMMDGTDTNNVGRSDGIAVVVGVLEGYIDGDDDIVGLLVAFIGKTDGLRVSTDLVGINVGGDFCGGFVGGRLNTG